MNKIINETTDQHILRKLPPGKNARNQSKYNLIQKSNDFINYRNANPPTYPKITRKLPPEKNAKNQNKYSLIQKSNDVINYRNANPSTYLNLNSQTENPTIYSNLEKGIWERMSDAIWNMNIF